jgi:cytochrome c-type biogenesis protein CcmH
MTTFIVVAAILTALAVAWVVRPLFKTRIAVAGVSANKLNAALYKDQLDALERDLARGAINAADYETTRDELQARLLEDTDQADAQAPAQQGLFTSRRTAAILMVLVPLGATLGYWWLGTPAAINPPPPQVAGAGNMANNSQMVQMVERMAERLKAEPNDPKGWSMLARSYKVIGRLPDAQQAFEKVGDLLYTDPNLLVEYADVLAANSGNRIDGKPLELVNKALQLNPQHPMALLMSGVAAYRRGDFKLAVQQWETLLGVLEPGSPDAQQVEADLADARLRAGIPAPAGARSGSALPPPGVNAAPGSVMPPPGGAGGGALPPGHPLTNGQPAPGPVQPGAAASPQMSQDQINQMIDRLAERMKQNPGDLPGWVRLARAYRVQGRLAEADDAFTKAAKLVETDADLLAQHADVIASRNGNRLEGKPMELVAKALKLNPRHPVALMMSGAAAFRRADYAKSVEFWERALAVLPPGSPDAEQVKQEIAEARRRGKLPAAK